MDINSALAVKPPSPWRRLKAYWSLTKSLQTGLLLVTGLAGYASAGLGFVSAPRVAAFIASLFLAVAGSTILNMVYDRDIDYKMERTCWRPLPAGLISPIEGTVLGVGMAVIGTAWASALSPLTGAVVFAGIFFNVIVYTIWLKRRTPWSIVWGGIAGGMPVLAGRTLATGQIDLTGLLLALAVLCWIPTHIMTFSIKYAPQYAAAGVPVFPTHYGEQATRQIIGISTVVAVVVMTVATWLTGLGGVYLGIAAGLGLALATFAVTSLHHGTLRRNTILYKLASLYMLGSMVLIIGS
jgi:heme o synthase